MRHRHITLGAMLILLAVFALEFAAMAHPTETRLSATNLVTLLTLLVALLGAGLGREPRGGWWGFAAFGWAYLLLVLGPLLPVESHANDDFWNSESKYDLDVFHGPGFHLATDVLHGLAEEALPLPPLDVNTDPFDRENRSAECFLERAVFEQMGQDVFCLLFAVLGAGLGILIAPGATRARADSAARSHPPDVTKRKHIFEPVPFPVPSSEAQREGGDL